jgi:hypothetical protein
MYAQNRKIGKPNKKSVGNNKPKGLKHDNQNQLRSPISEGGELKHDNQNQLRSPISEGGELKHDNQNQLRSPISEGGELKQDR